MALRRRRPPALTDRPVGVEVRRETSGPGRRPLAGCLRELTAGLLEAAEALGCELGDDGRIMLPLHLVASSEAVAAR